MGKLSWIIQVGPTSLKVEARGRALESEGEVTTEEIRKNETSLALKMDGGNHKVRKAGNL